MPCDHLIELHNDTGNNLGVYFVTKDNQESVVESAVVFNFCPVCGEQLRNITKEVTLS